MSPQFAQNGASACAMYVWCSPSREADEGAGGGTESNRPSTSWRSDCVGGSDVLSSGSVIWSAGDIVASSGAMNFRPSQRKM